MSSAFVSTMLVLAAYHRSRWSRFSSYEFLTFSLKLYAFTQAILTTDEFQEMAFQTMAFYQLDQPVGKDWPNQPDDLKLIEAIVEVLARPMPDEPDQGVERRSRDGKIDPLPGVKESGRNDISAMTGGHSQYLPYTIQLSVLHHSGPEEFLAIRNRLGLKYLPCGQRRLQEAPPDMLLFLCAAFTVPCWDALHCRFWPEPLRRCRSSASI